MHMSSSVDWIFLCSILLYLCNVCSSEVYTFGNDVISREHNDSLLNTVYILHHTDVMPVNGKILAWSMFTYKLGHVSCQIWRPINEQTKYQLIGQNVYNVTHTGVSHWMVTDDQQITFALGDMIGLYFEHENPIPFSKHTANNCSHPTLFVREHGIPEVGSTYNFRTHRDGWNPCRIYSLQLHIETKSNDSDVASTEGSMFKFPADITLCVMLKERLITMQNIYQQLSTSIMCFLFIIACIIFLVLLSIFVLITRRKLFTTIIIAEHLKGMSTQMDNKPLLNETL